MLASRALVIALVAASVVRAEFPPAPPPADAPPPGTPGVKLASAQEPIPTPAPAAKEETLKLLPPMPEWYEPGYWMPPDIWSGSFEIGINGSEGNADSFSMRVGGNLKKKTDWDQFEWKVTHAKTESRGIMTQNNAIMNAREEIFLGDTRWSVFQTTFLEYDEFKAFDLRLVLNAGVGYLYYKSDSTKLKGRFGAGTSREFDGPSDEWVPEGVFGIDFDHQFSKKQKITATVEYFPDWDDFSDYRLVTNVGWELLLDEVSNLNLKIGVIDRYDSTPHGLKPNDFDYSILLMWKL